VDWFEITSNDDSLGKIACMNFSDFRCVILLGAKFVKVLLIFYVLTLCLD